MQSTRLHALDAIRGTALLLGLLLHGSMSFWPGMEELGYPIVDNSKSMTLAYMFYVLHMFRMSVFFLIAGFFAHLSLQRKGAKIFLHDRLKRIALPMVLAAIISLVLITPIFIWAAYKLFGPDYLTILQSSQQTAPAQPLLMHFWFLYYLLWFYFIAVGCSQLLGKLDPQQKLMNRITSLVFLLCKYRFLVLIAAGLSTLFLYQRENWAFWVGIPTPTEAVWNEAPAFFIYGAAFFIGWLFDRERECFQVLKRHWLHYLILAILLTVFCISNLDPQPFIIDEVAEREKLIYAIAYSLASWCWIFSMIGAGMKFFDRESTARRYFADASYWIYIAHLPLLFLLQTLLMNVPLHWTIKFPLIMVISTTLLLWSYEKWVRYSFIGNTLNGPRQRKSTVIEKPEALHTSN